MVKLGSNFLKASDCKEGDIIEFLNEGEWVKSEKYTYPDGNPKNQFQIKVKHQGNEKLLGLNKISRDSLCSEFGGDTNYWIGKKAKLRLIPLPQLKTSMIQADPIV